MVAEVAAHASGGAQSNRTYVLGALLVVYTFNFIDRILIGVVQEPVAREFGLSDFQIGVLGGPAFALLYTLLGIPIARYAERANRITIVTLGMALWSGMTAACGFSANYLQLLLARIGVGIGEAACTPASHSALSDYFPPDRRASALAIYSLGIPLGTLVAAFGGGWLTQTFDWRTAFWLLGAPGLAVALLVKLTVREAPRPQAVQTVPTFAATMAAILCKPTFRHVALAGALMSFVAYGTSQFLVSYFVRNYGLGIAHGSYAFGIFGGFAVGLGTFLGGFVSDRLAPRYPRALVWLPAVGCLVSIPLYLTAFAQSQFALGFPCLLLAAIFQYLCVAPVFAVAQCVAPPRMRATAAAVLLLIINLVGYGLGPPAVGALADSLMSSLLTDAGLSLDACTGAGSSACANARGTGLRYALGTTVIVMGWAALHFLLAGRTLVRDRVD